MSCSFTDHRNELTPQSAAERMECSLRTIYRMIDEGELEVRRTPMGRLRIPTEKVEEARARRLRALETLY